MKKAEIKFAGSTKKKAKALEAEDLHKECPKAGVVKDDIR